MTLGLVLCFVGQRTWTSEGRAPCFVLQRNRIHISGANAAEDLCGPGL